MGTRSPGPVRWALARGMRDGTESDEAADGRPTLAVAYGSLAEYDAPPNRWALTAVAGDSVRSARTSRSGACGTPPTSAAIRAGIRSFRVERTDRRDSPSPPPFRDVRHTKARCPAQACNACTYRL